MTPTTVAMDMSPEAAERIAELGIQAEVDRMIEHAVKTVDGIRRVEISLVGPYDTHDEPYLSARAYRDLALWSGDNQELSRFSDWMIETFSPEVLWRFTLHIRPGAPHAG
jgi:hypothetical protein